MTTSADLTRKQRLFVEHYLVDLNACQAAIRAGYSAKTAQVQGSRLLSNAKVSEGIRAGYQTKLARVEEEAAEAVLTRQEVLREDSRIATSNLFDFIQDINREGVVWKNPADLPPEVTRVVQEYRYDPEKRSVTIKLHSKHPALEGLAKHHQIFRGTEPQEKPKGSPHVVERSEESNEPGAGRRSLAKDVQVWAEMLEMMDAPVSEFMERMKQKELSQ